MQPLLMVKRLFMEASSYADRGDPVSSGIAISMLQDSADLYLRTLIKDRKLQMNANFPTNIATLRNNKISMPYAAKLEELNTARVNFKHYLNLPAVDEAKKHQTYVEDFLRSAMLDHFQISFDELSLADLVTDPEIKAHLKAAEENVETGSFTEAAKDLAKAKTALFSKLENYIPKVDVKLRQVDRAINSIDSVGHANPVTYLTHYLNLLRETSLVALLRVPFDDYKLLRRLPAEGQTIIWHSIQKQNEYTAAECRRAISCMVTLCIRFETL